MKKLIGSMIFSVVFMGIYLHFKFEITMVLLLVVIATEIIDIQDKIDKNN